MTCKVRKKLVNNSPARGNMFKESDCLVFCNSFVKMGRKCEKKLSLALVITNLN